MRGVIFLHPTMNASNNNNNKKDLTKKQARIIRRNKYKNVDWQKQIDKVVRFCNKKGFTVKFDDCCSIVYFDDLLITINNRISKERMFYCLLHELGHVLIHEDVRSYYHNIGFTSKHFHRNSMTQKISEVEEEFLAWRIGYKQAKFMRLKVDRVEYEKFKASYISSYFEWAIKRNINKLIEEKSEEKLRFKIAALKKETTKKKC
jgi:Zn-dependent peptidase ImmA (M78 family)